MAGYRRLYVVGGEGGFQGADGVNPIELQILVGQSDREWLQPHYFDRSIRPLGRLRTLIPARPGDPDALLDACVAFAPRYFEGCASLPEVAEAVANQTGFDFHLDAQRIPPAWPRLREEARPQFAALKIWQADLERYAPHGQIVWPPDE